MVLSLLCQGRLAAVHEAVEEIYRKSLSTAKHLAFPSLFPLAAFMVQSDADQTKLLLHSATLSSVSGAPALAPKAPTSKGSLC